MENIFGTRMRQARMMKKMSLDNLAAQLGEDGVSKQALSKYENGEMKPSTEILSRLKEILGVTEEYLYSPLIFNIETTNIEFRKKKMNVKELDAMKIRIQGDIEKYIAVRQLLGATKGNIYNLTEPEGYIKERKDAESFASRVRAEWKLGEAAIVNVYSLLSDAGITMVETTEGPDFDGVSGEANGYKVIVLNKTKDDNVERRRFTALHELGHMMMGKHLDTSLKPKDVENICDAFASEMLMPSARLKEIAACRPEFSNRDLDNIRTSYGISIDAIMLKLKYLDMISTRTYNTYIFKRAKSDKFRAFATETKYRETKPETLKDMVLRAVSAGMMTTEMGAQMAGIEMEEILSSTEYHIKINQNSIWQ